MGNGFYFSTRARQQQQARERERETETNPFFFFSCFWFLGRCTILLLREGGEREREREREREIARVRDKPRAREKSIFSKRRAREIFFYSTAKQTTPTSFFSFNSSSVDHHTPRIYEKKAPRAKKQREGVWNNGSVCFIDLQALLLSFCFSFFISQEDHEKTKAKLISQELSFFLLQLHPHPHPHHTAPRATQ